MPVTVKRIQFTPPELPCQVDLLIADAETEELATVWIAARFPLEKPSDLRLPGLVSTALDRLQTLIDAGKAHAEKEPTVRTE